MINTWFISDTHFGHKNILEYEKYHRPFTNLNEMHEYIIQMWNNVVRPNDKVYHLGDFCFGRQNIKIASRLNGRKRLVMGNHDKYQASEYLKYFEGLYGMIFWEKCVLSHMPVHREFGGRCMVNVHGHLHSKNVLDSDGQIDQRFYNVSVEQNNLTPIHADLIRKRVLSFDGD